MTIWPLTKLKFFDESYLLYNNLLYIVITVPKPYVGVLIIEESD